MKKGTLLCFASLLLLSSCGGGAKPVSPSEPNIQSGASSKAEISKEENSAASKEEGGKWDKAAVVYFSCTNHTKGVAEKISSYMSAPLLRIEPKIAYTDADLDYTQSDCRANREQNDSSARPEIKEALDVSSYDSLFLGYPIWWGKLPKIICTFCESEDLSGKTIIPFCTSGGSGIATSVSELKTLNPNSTVLDGRRFSSSASQSEVASWADSL